uniref:1,4-dihydroxy-2-naphthoate octaprenyltransferase n=1 Tax=Tetraselmis sp. GSL018 TaxID=582737 RepID=A0A061SC63_9CHLO
MKDNPIALPPDRRELWKAAIKIPMYSVAVVPITVGSAAAFLETGKFAASQFGGVLLASLLIIAWLNLSNDAFDAETDVDKGKPESVVNLLGGNRRAVLLMSLAAFAAGAGIMAASLAPVVQADPRVGAWLAAAVACGYVYQGPPFRLSYKGLGEPLCFAAFGPLATGAFYLAQRFAASPGSAGAPVAGLLWLCSAIVGVTTSAILFCSHFHQISGDRAAGKMSPLVRLGGALGARVLNGAVAAPYMALAVATATGAAPWPLVAASAVSLPAAVFLVDFVTSSYSKPEVVRFSKLHAISWHVAFGFSLTAALVFLRFAAAMPWIAVTLPS